MLLPTTKDRQAWWSKHICWLLGLRFEAMPDCKPLVSDQKVIYLVNHRSLADFFVHDVIVQHKASYLAREMVRAVFPLTFLATRYQNSIWFFRRGIKNTRPYTKFFAWLDEMWACPNTRRPGLVVYPEGHRNTSPHPLRLKRGMIQYAYDRCIPVQIVLAFGLEEAVNENEFRVDTSGCLIRYTVDEPLFPNKYSSEDEFYEAVQERFNSKFYEMNPSSSRITAQQQIDRADNRHMARL
eukprot:GILK01002773.1.p1 GENE.GILK01002773.1~~GILK01002773.1.p1  ORF type:complete len:239 (-),score=37.67 GILK01002773.1:176-892(-)